MGKRASQFVTVSMAPREKRATDAKRFSTTGLGDGVSKTNPTNAKV